MKKRVPLRMDEAILENVDIFATATGSTRTAVIEKFCVAGLMGVQRRLEEKKKEVAVITPEE